MAAKLRIGVLCLASASLFSGCAAAVGAAVAAKDIRRGLAGVHQLVASSQSLTDAEAVVLPRSLTSPLTGTYRAVQLLGSDSVTYFLRTVSRPTAPIVASSGEVAGYVLAGIAAASLDTLEARVRKLASGREVGGSAMFFVEGVRPPEPRGRTLYAATYLGRLPSGESPAADHQYALLEAMEVDLEAPDLEQMVGQGISHELFRQVADGVFTLTSSGDARFIQEYAPAKGRTLTVRLDRISGTTLPEPEWLTADRLAAPARD